MQKAAVKRSDTLTIKKGERIEFPVPEGHPYARFQKLTTIKNTDEIAPFVELWRERAVSFGRAFPETTALNRAVSKGNLRLLEIKATNFVVLPGTVVTLNSPLNLLEFDNVTIEGDLVSRGDLVVRCKNLSA